MISCVFLFRRLVVRHFIPALFLSSLILVLHPVKVNAIPVLPHYFYGKAEINGSQAPQGTMVGAIVVGRPDLPQYTTTIDANGQYGIGDNPFYIPAQFENAGSIIPGALPDEKIQFSLNGVKFGNPISFVPGGMTENNISQDNIPPTVQFSQAVYTKDEAANTATITTTLSKKYGLSVSVNYATSNDTAVAGSDYTSAISTLTFTPGQTSQSFSVPIINDTLDETNESLNLTLSDPVNATLGAPADAVLTILDDDAPPTVQFSSAVLAVDENVGTAVITATLRAASAQTVTVSYVTNNGTAIAPGDYTATSGMLTFAPSETSKDIAVPIQDDLFDEVDKTLSLALSNSTYATLGDPSIITLTILDNDGPEVAFSSTSYSVNEGGGNAVISVTLSATSAQTITVAYSASNGTATAGNDYTATNGTLAFVPGEQVRYFSVPIIDDNTLLEVDETLTLTLRDPIHATLGNPTIATVTILENDVNAPPVEVSAPSDPSQPVSVSVNTPAGTVQMTLEDVRAGGTITTTVSVTAPNQPPGNFSLLGLNFEVTASDISFGRVTLQFPYRDVDVAAAGVTEESLRLLHFEGGKWEDITTGLDIIANIITGVTDSFSPFVLGVQTMQNCAISLNSGALYTGRLNVQVFSNMPDAAEMLVSNDAGFTGSQWQSYHSALNWTVSDPGNRIVTLLVYVRLRDAHGSLLCSGVSLIDDIFYDPLAPSVISVTVQPGQGSMLKPQALDSFTLHLSAADQQGGSGIADMQISTDANFTGARWQSFTPTSQVTAQPGGKVYVRVRDGVGNLSNIASVSISGQRYIFLPLTMR